MDLLILYGSKSRLYQWYVVDVDDDDNNDNYDDDNDDNYNILMMMMMHVSRSK